MTSAPRAGRLRAALAMTPGARHSVVVLFALTVALATGNFFFSGTQAAHLRGVISAQQAQARVQAGEVARLRTAVLASCAFAADLGTAPLPSSPRPSELGVKLVTDSRAQWRKLGCPGTLPAPPGLAHWAAVYHLPAG